jgi:hypothetical protein
MMRIARWALVILLAAPLGATFGRTQQTQPPPPSEQQPRQEDSLAAAARRAREQKKGEPKPKKVWDNDSIPELGSASVVGNQDNSSAAAGDSANTPAKQGQSAAGIEQDNSAKKAQDNTAAAEAAKANLENLKSELDILQRKLALDQQSYYGKPDYSSDKAGAAALQDEQSQVDAKQQEVDDAQKKFDDLPAQSDSTSPADNTPK